MSQVLSQDEVDEFMSNREHWEKISWDEIPPQEHSSVLPEEEVARLLHDISGASDDDFDLPEIDNDMPLMYYMNVYTKACDDLSKAKKDLIDAIERGGQ